MTKETFYHLGRDQARAVADEMAKDVRVEAVSISLEPDNGWVVVVYPKLHDLSDLFDRAEVRAPDGYGQRLSPRPAEYKGYRAPVKAAKVQREPKERKAPQPVVILTGANQLPKPWATAKPAPAAAPVQAQAPAPTLPPTNETSAAPAARTEPLRKPWE